METQNKHRTNRYHHHDERKPNSDTIVSSPNCLCAPRRSWLPLYNLRQSTSLRRGERGLETPSAPSWCPQSKKASYWCTYARQDSVHYPQHFRVSSTISSNGPKLGIRQSPEWVAIRLDSFGRHWALTHFLGLAPPSTWPVYSPTGSSPRTPETCRA